MVEEAEKNEIWGVNDFSIKYAHSAVERGRSENDYRWGLHLQKPVRKWAETNDVEAASMSIKTNN